MKVSDELRARMADEWQKVWTSRAYFDIHKMIDAILALVPEPAPDPLASLKDEVVRTSVACRLPDGNKYAQNQDWEDATDRLITAQQPKDPVRELIREARMAAMALDALGSPAHGNQLRCAASAAEARK
jgi:hypothetical protein